MVKVLKFGGTSVGSADNMRKVASIIKNEGAKVTVLSAMSETTNGLVKICQLASNGEFEQESYDYLKAKYKRCVEELLQSKEEALTKIDSVFIYIKEQALNFNQFSENNILAQGELLTSAIFTMYLNESGVSAELINIPDFMRTDGDGLADADFLKENLSKLVESRDKAVYFVTQGFICRNDRGELDNLGRGGSDYSAALIGAAIGSSEVQIWTDIDGIHNNDPRFVDNTYPIREMNFTQAAELAYFGAKILHPATIQPCKKEGIPVRLKNTMEPAAAGTLITNANSNTDVKYLAVAAKDDVISIRICSARMLMAYGFLRKVFEVFEKYKTPIDMITTSEVAVSLTIDCNNNLDAIIHDLEPFGNVTYEKDNTIICVVGEMSPTEPGVVAKILDCMTNISVKMMSYGASDNSVAFMIDHREKVNALNQLNESLFKKQ